MNRTGARVLIRAYLTALILISAVFVCLSQEPGQFSIDESPLPAPTGFVNDHAGVLDAATKSQIETRLTEFKNNSNPPTELAVAIVRTTGDRPIFDYSLAVARGWKIGSKDDDNPSALLLIAIDDRKYFTQISRDLEDELPDGLVGSLQRQFLVPEFKKGNYGKGISDTIDAYIRTINDRRNGTAAPTRTPTPRATAPVSLRSGYNLICCGLVVGVIILLIILSRRGGPRGPSNKDRSRWGGGGVESALPWVIGSMLGSGGSGSSSNWGGSSGGWDSGGFGGFGGGGDFGGGGAGGDW